MRVLVACEYSGRVREAFAARGHDAWSCDLLPTEQPGQHIQGDVLEVISRGGVGSADRPSSVYVPGGLWPTLEQAPARARPADRRCLALRPATARRANPAHRAGEPCWLHQHAHPQARPDHPAVQLRRGCQQVHVPVAPWLAFA